ncbi:MAG: hypothetical protein ABUT20_59920 [Bacteroidota bacterium]
MKKFIYLVLLIFAHEFVFAQANVQDGIYLVDQLTKNSQISPKDNKAALQFNRFFVNDETGNYPPVVVHTDDFVPLELADLPVIQHELDNNDQLIVKLTSNASERLREFTARNMMGYVAVVVDTEVLAIYKVVQPVAGTFIKITKCDGQGCDQVYYRLRRSIRR